MARRIYVRLLDEGPDVWRPVEARDLGGGLFEILGSQPSGQNWEFPPGAFVRCARRKFEGKQEREELVAISRDG
jgi:hypothetical protein